ncbi:MAG: Signal transduction response regulator [Promethearchaeota archaeon]|nr:MAG: Signal transduction response regulator [Candidatus Lokiarchaeota archaeon]
MKPSILLVEDENEILDSLKSILENNGYKVSVATNGRKALNLLQSKEKKPDLIISDIMMPDMNGYELFKEISRHEYFNTIPFLFLTGKKKKEEIRLGKLLGIDDYITKPYKVEDLLAIIKGKLLRYKKIRDANIRIKKVFKNKDISLEPSLQTDGGFDLILLHSIWDDRYGPVLKSYFPENENYSFSLENAAKQLFQSSTLIYGQKRIENPEGILLDLQAFGKTAYVFFDSYKKTSERAREKQFMIAVLAPNISYLESLIIKKIFEELSVKIKEEGQIDLSPYWERIYHALTHPVV